MLLIGGKRGKGCSAVVMGRVKMEDECWNARVGVRYDLCLPVCFKVNGGRDILL